ncbi:hypothetical protein GCM10009786_09100 [Leucobacter alluvii]|uniref:Uncharacterized protein n=1 Tax=Leucobacter alluvii TaxID=340321 RepID=A0ABN3B3T4_9MICO
MSITTPASDSGETVSVAEANEQFAQDLAEQAVQQGIKNPEEFASLSEDEAAHAKEAESRTREIIGELLNE